MNLKFSKLNILVIGEVMLDIYSYGKSYRESPEGPIPVIVESNDEYLLGGAANVANNIKKLDAQVSLMSILGKDSEGVAIKKLLNKSEINSERLLELNEYSTIVKKRIFANDQPIARIDREVIKQNDNLLFQKNNLILEGYDGVIISDYDKGLITEKSARNIIKACNKFNIPVIVDTKKTNFDCFSGASFITPNISEIKSVLSTSKNFDSISQECFELVKRLKLKEGLLITKSEKGMSLFTSKELFSEDGLSVENPDVSGAGDTVVAIFTLSYLLKNKLEDCLKISNFAGSIVVNKKNTALVSTKEIKSVFNN